MLLENVFRRRGWKLAWAGDRREAREILDDGAAQVVITTRDLPDGGGWREMLEEARAFPHQPLLVVTCRLADDRLWAEVLNLGGYDVLACPLDAEEVTRVLGAACRHFVNERERRGTKVQVLTAAV